MDFKNWSDYIFLHWWNFSCDIWFRCRHPGSDVEKTVSKLRQDWSHSPRHIRRSVVYPNPHPDREKKTNKKWKYLRKNLVDEPVFPGRQSRCLSLSFELLSAWLGFVGDIFQANFWSFPSPLPHLFGFRAVLSVSILKEISGLKKLIANIIMCRLQICSRQPSSWRDFLMSTDL